MTQPNDSLAIGSAIYSRLTSQGTVSVYHMLAPEGSTPPYVIYQRMAASDEYTFTTHGMDTDYMVKVVSNRKWSSEAQNVYTHIHVAMQDAPLNITGYTSLRCRRKSTLEYPDMDQFWHVGGIYAIEII